VLNACEAKTENVQLSKADQLSGEKKKLRYCIDSARWQSLHRSRSFKVTVWPVSAFQLKAHMRLPITE